LLVEEHSAGSPEVMVPEELRSRFNEAQMRGLGAWIAATLGSTKVTYSYDAEGRMIGKQTSSTDNESVTMSYNDRGDKIQESGRSVRDATASVEFSLDDQGNMLPTTEPKPLPPHEFEIDYEYQYDAQGNWTEMKVTHRSQSPVPSQQSEIHRRELSYY
jgi:hypothetical protein